MKKFFTGLLCIIVGIFIGCSSIIFLSRYTDSSILRTLLDSNSGTTYITSDSSKTESDDLISLALSVAQYIKDGDYASLSKVVHPERGVSFTPSSTVNTSTDKWFKASEVAGFYSDDTVYVWGIDNAKGDPIEMTVKEYFRKYVNNVDYTQAPEFGVNYIVQTGNALENVSSVFSDAQFVDLHYPGTAANDYLDWSTLRLVFEDYKGSPMLVAIIHCEWTI